MKITQPFRIEFSLPSETDGECIIKEFKFDVTFDDSCKFMQQMYKGCGNLFDSYMNFLTKQELRFGGLHCAQLDDDFLGFDSYEVEEKNIIKLMNIWRKYFIAKKFECTEIVEVQE